MANVANFLTNIFSIPQVALVFPNNDPVAFMVAFYGCLLAEVVPVPIEVPLSRKVRFLHPPEVFRSLHKMNLSVSLG